MASKPDRYGGGVLPRFLFVMARIYGDFLDLWLRAEGSVPAQALLL